MKAIRLLGFCFDSHVLSQPSSSVIVHPVSKEPQQAGFYQVQVKPIISATVFVALCHIHKALLALFEVLDGLVASNLVTVSSSSKLVQSNWNINCIL